MSLKSLAEHLLAKSQRKEKKKNRHGNVAERTHHAGYSFASKLEARVYDMLMLRQKAGDIRDIRAQVTIHLTEARIGYRADFQFVDCSTGNIVYAEAKGGFESEVWLLKKRLYRYYGPAPLELWIAGKSGPILKEIIVPGRSGT